METVAYSPLNLFLNFQDAANQTPDAAIIFDQPFPLFPNLVLKALTTTLVLAY
ncbi:hypothetical protein IGI47_001581 [Enterococcus sp. AZ191]